MENAAKRRWFVRGDVQMCLAPQRRAIFRHLTFKKWSGPVSFFTILTWKCASRHSGAPFLRIATCKMAPALRGFVHFDAQMCFAPQRRAIFEHRNFQNGSGNVVFCTFWLSNVLFATAACHFSPVRRTATSAPAALASLLFEHQEPRFIEKTQRFATSLTFFAHVELLASDSTRMLICSVFVCFCVCVRLQMQEHYIIPPPNS